MPSAQKRAENFERLIEAYDERQVPKVLDFADHRFVTVERDSVTGATYVRGHKSMRGACNYLARVIASAERFVPEHVVDLDSGEVQELDVFAFVAPKGMDAVAVMMPRVVAEIGARAVLESDVDGSHGEMSQLHKLLTQALERRT